MTSNQLAFILTCTLWNRISVCAGESLCTQAPEFQLPSGGQSEVWETLGSFVALNCTAVLSWNQTDQRCDATSRTLLWSKDGTPLNLSLYPQNTSTWTPSQSQMIVSSVLQVQVREQADFGLYSCEVRNTSADFSLQNTAQPSHTASVIAAISLFLILTIAAVVYSRCRLNIKLWYRNSYGDYEINDGKLHDAYFSYVNNEYDRKLVNFILKPHLVNKSGHKLHLSDNNILPGGEPSAEFLMNVSHCRRLIVVMSHAYLEQDWCCNNFSCRRQCSGRSWPWPCLIGLCSTATRQGTPRLSSKTIRTPCSPSTQTTWTVALTLLETWAFISQSTRHWHPEPLCCLCSPRSLHP
ncbi:single Ig IL-1-related receptor-like isoform X2 [Oncorhynchus clarkii lewisi]|uniref:single Ig IL-1-related receptor-like isoform X2 n=1 Tax=Oncorhynchus clarkii lewisi TaxID=490388 RepID=UPI0039B86AE4